MMRSLVIFLTLVASTSCTKYIGALKDGRYENNYALREMSLDIDELKDTLQQARLDQIALEDRLQSQESELVTLRQGTKNGQPNNKEFTALAKKIDELQRIQSATLADIRSLSTHSQKTTTSLTTYRDKIQEIENKVALQDKRLSEVVKLKETLTTISHAMKNPEQASQPITYRVEAGDTLGKIALKNNTSVRKIKELNQLASNQIYVGQKLKIPST